MPLRAQLNSMPVCTTTIRYSSASATASSEVCTGVSSVKLGSWFFFSSRRRHTRFDCDWSVCSSDLWERTERPGDDGAERIHVGGVPIDVLDIAGAVGRISAAFGQRPSMQVSTVNLDFLVQAHSD